MLNPSVFSASQHAQFPRWAACLAVTSLLALSGCAAVELKLGMKVHLEKVPVTSMQATMPKGPGIAPGEKSPLVVTFTRPDGKSLKTEGAGQGKVMWKDLTVTTSVVEVNKKGIVSLRSDPRVSDGKLPHVIIIAPSHPDLRAEFDVPLRYDRKFSSYFSGSSGSSGTTGTSGSDGTSGSMGSFDPDHPKPGGDGGDGTDGGNGGNGGRGEDGPPVFVRVALRSGDRPLLQVGVSTHGGETFFLVDPQGGSLTVSSAGGSGGSGGKGGRGGRGGSGGSGIPSGSRGRDGSDGHDGSDGPSGNGGKITVTYDPDAGPFLSAIRLSNAGGPRPVYLEQPVAALW
ncbi:MAG TPA: hypothetical protein VKL40_10865 [Candidatus Angelobacter sp.]|nr:hypothetical protein [Candidatus Angelobacter sp.]